MKANTTNIEFLKALKKTTFFMPYNINDDTLEAWGKFLNETEPEITTNRLNLINAKFATGQVIFDSKLGISNIFIGFVYIVKDRLRYLDSEISNDEIRAEKNKLIGLVMKYRNLIEEKTNKN